MRLLELNLGFGTNKVVVAEITEAHSENGTKRVIAKRALELIKETDKSMIDYIDNNYDALLKSFIKKIYECYSKVSGYEYIEVKPVLKRKKKAGVMINARDAEMKIIGSYEMQPYKTNVEAFKCVDLYVKKLENGYWNLTEPSTGWGLINPCSTKKALETELEKISSKVDSIKEKIQEVVANYGHANPHLQDQDKSSSNKTEIENKNRSDEEMKIETKFEYYEIEQEDFDYNKGYFKTNNKSCSLTVSATNEETCNKVLDNFREYIEDNTGYCSWDGSEDAEYDELKNVWTGLVEIYIDNKKEFKKLEKLYKKWKNNFNKSDSEKKTNGCYWHGNGKYQNEADKISKLIPDVGYTNNKYMNLFIIGSNIYHDFYNNGGGNIKYVYDEPITKYLIPFNEHFRIDLTGGAEKIAKKLYNKKTLENFFNRVVEIVKDKDLSYYIDENK